MDSFTKFTQNVSTNWTPFASKVGRSLTQYKQLATEKLQSNVETTALPSDYLQLEKQFEATRQHTQKLLRLANHFITPPASQYDMQAIQQTVSSLTAKINTAATAATAGNSGGAARGSVVADEKVPGTVEHGFSREALEYSEKIGLEHPLGAALFKFGSIEEKVGTGRLKMDSSVQRGFVGPLEDMLRGGIQMAQTGRKEVLAARLTLDAAKKEYRSAAAVGADAQRAAVEKAEDHFVTVIEEAMRLMKAVVESPEHLVLLSGFVQSQLAYHREAAELLADLAPEIEEIKVTQEAIYRHQDMN
ncbi:BAR domain-containing protein [Kickxella alabastrina]|uniref:BAR domain-containing protein n=1 Tax=Kickxella alabastrina TaxID=61397 RepID=A0ACC1IQ18_9FUNG|nr:BAR domain-containing protein [Kickxella alabastrina]